MRVTTVFKYTASFEYWAVDRNITTGEYSYNKIDDRQGMMVPVSGNIQLTTDKQMIIGSQVRVLRDRSGTEVTMVGTTSYPLYVHSAEPQLDPFANVVGWRHSLRREPPRDMQEFIRDLVDRANP